MRKVNKKWTILLFCFIGALIGIKFTLSQLTDGFKLKNIRSNLPFQSDWNTPIAQSDFLETQKAISQKYDYLASGSQSYVFLSEDKKYVIKFFKHKRWKLNSFYSHIPLPSTWKKKQRHWKEKKWKTVNKTFKSCKISYELFKKETGVLYIHLNKTNLLNQTLIVKDRIGMTHALELDKLQFVVQKKAVPTDIYLTNLRNKGKVEEAKEAIKKLLDLTKMRAKLGYSDKDPHLIRNFGFLDQKAVQIDIGGFHRDPKKDLAYYQSQEIFKIQDKFLPWIEENYPEIAPFTKKQIEMLSKGYNSR